MTLLVDPPAVARRHVESVLGADAAVVAIIGVNTDTGDPQVYWWQAPASGFPVPPGPFDPPNPYIIHQSQDGGGTPIDVMNTDDPLVQWDGLWTVRMTARGDDLARLETLNMLVYRALEGTSAEYPDMGARIVTCGLSAWLVIAPETVDGVRYEHRGGVYTISVQPF